MSKFLLQVKDFCVGRQGAWWTVAPWKYLWNICGRHDCGFCAGLRTIYVTVGVLYVLVFVCALIERVIQWIS